MWSSMDWMSEWIHLWYDIINWIEEVNIDMCEMISRLKHTLDTRLIRNELRLASIYSYSFLFIYFGICFRLDRSYLFMIKVKNWISRLSSIRNLTRIWFVFLKSFNSIKSFITLFNSFTFCPAYLRHRRFLFIIFFKGEIPFQLLLWSYQDNFV